MNRLSLLPLLLLLAVFAAAQPRPRLFITTDIGGDPDDTQSLIRLLVYSNEFELAGLVASASGTPGELKEAIVRPDLIEELVQAYGEVAANLQRHDPHYPSADALLSLIKRGNPQRGWEHVGEGHDTEGSDWIIAAVDRDERPLNIAVWGGQTDLAQALWRVKHERSKKAYRRFIGKLRVYDIADQDGIFSQIRAEHSGLFYILNKAPEGQDKRNAVFRGMYLGGDESLTSLDWLNAHVIEGHGPLGARYPQKTWTAPNPHGVMKEGDTPSWFYFLPNGLQDPGRPEYGGWGGRFRQTAASYYADAVDQIEDARDARTTVWRWRPDFQRAFAARMDRCVLPPGQVNRAPEAIVNGQGGTDFLFLKAKSGESIRLDASASRDPDGDALQFEWWVYPEVSGGQSWRAEGPQATLTLPALRKGQEIHLILQVTDAGTPALRAYRRVILQGK